MIKSLIEIKFQIFLNLPHPMLHILDYKESPTKHPSPQLILSLTISLSFFCPFLITSLSPTSPNFSLLLSLSILSVPHLIPMTSLLSFPFAHSSPPLHTLPTLSDFLSDERFRSLSLSPLSPNCSHLP
jgi:hypothetical protein